MRAILSAFLFIQACGTTSPNMGDTVKRPAPAPDSAPTTDSRIIEGMRVWLEDCNLYSSYDCSKLADTVDTYRLSKEGELEQGVLGTCQLWSIGMIITKREIILSPEVVKVSAVLRGVLAHEMGHCSLLIDHVENDPTHLMAPYLSTDTRVLEERLPAMLQRFYSDAQQKVLPVID